MKKINLLLCTLAIAGLGFTSCSDDDNENNNNVSIGGTYHLDEVNTAEATDFDKDGDFNIDQTEESNCYEGGKITLNDDNSFTYVIKGILVSDGAAGCSDSYTATGVYTTKAASNPENALITLTYTDQSGEVVNRVFTKIGKELIWDDNTILSSYPDRDNDGIPVMTMGSVQYVYEK